MKTKHTAKQSAVFLAVLMLTAMLAGCGGSSRSAEPQEAAVESYAAYDSEALMTFDNGSAAGGSGIILPEDGRQISLTAFLTMESLDFDATCESLRQEAAALGGHISTSDMFGGDGIRSASFTFKIPADRYGEFLDSAARSGNVIARSETSEDLTEQFVDVEARLRSLRAQEDRLLEMMAGAQELSDLILIQEQLSNVQYEIESYTVQQRNLDSRVDYSTVHVTVQEVEKITEVQDSYWSRIAAAFRDGWSSAADALQELSIWLVYLLPLILVAAVILVVVLVINRRLRKKRALNPPSAKPAVYPPVPAAQPGAPYPGAPYSPYPPYPVPRVGPAGEAEEDEPKTEE